MKLVTLACNNCGAPLSVPEDANFITCNHCGTSLAVRRDASVTYTEKIEQIARRTEKMADDVAQLRYESELARIDREWEQEREKHLVKGKHGSSEPSAAAGIIGGLIAVVFGIFFASSAGGMGAPAIFPLAGVFFAVLGVVIAIASIAASAKYRAAHEEYLEKRARLKKPD